MTSKILILGLIYFCLTFNCQAFTKIYSENKSLSVKKCHDFSITGDGNNSEWGKADWHQLSKLDQGGAVDESKFKIMYSEKGIYVLFSGLDNLITTKYDKDFGDLFNGDVFEVFFHTDTKIPLYLEYEINQLDKELVLIIPNINGKFNGWLPWNYENERRVVKKVSLKAGKMEIGSTIQSWSSELFFPYSLFNPLSNVPPKSGTSWNANFYRLDYDTGKMIKWSWAPIKSSFHEFEKFGTIHFE